MKKASKLGSATRPAQKPSATKQSSAKSKTANKSSTKPKPKKAEGQAELAQVVAQLAISADKLAQAADRLTQATLGKSHKRDRAFKTLSESIADVTASEGHAEVAHAPDSTASGEHPEMPDETEDR